MEQNLPTPVTHPPSRECTCTVTRHTHPKNYIHKYEQLDKLEEISFLKQESEKELDKLTFNNSEFFEREIWHFH